MIKSWRFVKVDALKLCVVYDLIKLTCFLPGKFLRLQNRTVCKQGTENLSFFPDNYLDRSSYYVITFPTKDGVNHQKHLDVLTTRVDPLPSILAVLAGSCQILTTSWQPWIPWQDSTKILLI